MAKKKAKRKLKRRLLGVGHPFFQRSNVDHLINADWPSQLVLLDANFGKCKRTMRMSQCGIGAYQKVKVYLEWY